MKVKRLCNSIQDPPVFEDLDKTIQKEQRFRRLHTLAPEIESTLHRDFKRDFMAKYRFIEMLSKYTNSQITNDSKK